MTTRSAWMTFALISVAGCGGGGGETTAPLPGGNTTIPAGGIAVTNNSFSPAAKTVPVGTTVTWAWSTCTEGDVYGGETCVAHSVNFDDGIRSATQQKGSFSRTFNAAGSYPYHCAVHGAAMSGSVTVQ